MKEVDDGFLKGKFLKRFEKIRKDVDYAYEHALDSLIDKSQLKYVPTVWIVPFVIVQELEMSKTKYRRTYYAHTYLDSRDLTRFAIYPSLETIEKFPNYLSAMFGHELAHVIAFGGGLTVTKDQVVETIIDPIRADKKKEEEMRSALASFREQFRKQVIEWDGVSAQKEFKAFLVDRAWTINKSGFIAFAFGEKRKVLEELIKSKTLAALE